MTNKEAIGFLDNMKSEPVDYGELVGAPSPYLGIHYVHTEPEDYAIDLAIKVLEQLEKEKWIPVSERCPEEYKVEVLTMPERNYAKSDTVYVTYIENGNRYTSNDYTVEGTWIMNTNVIAWRPMPEPYSEDEI